MARGRDRQLHRLVLVDRGEGHVHRWHPTCLCGWVGRFRRRQHEATAMYRQHELSRTRNGSPLAPRLPTRSADLPDQLR